MNFQREVIIINLLEAIKARHSVRSYKEEKIEGETLEKLRKVIDDCRRQSGLNIQLCLNEPEAFGGMVARYGKFRNVRNYLILAGQKSDNLQEKCGYYGEKIVLRAQQLGLNTCWVGASYSKKKGKEAAKLSDDEKLVIAISIGYGAETGALHTRKSLGELSNLNASMPVWFQRGVEATQEAPSAMNQQKFHFELLEGNKVKAETAGGFYTKVDLGIAKYHFEIGAGEAEWTWAE